MLRTLEEIQNDPPIKRKRFFGRVFCFYSIPAKYHHGLLRVVVIFFGAPTDGSVDRGDPVGGGQTPI